MLKINITNITTGERTEGFTPSLPKVGQNLQVYITCKNKESILTIPVIQRIDHFKLFTKLYQYEYSL